MDGHEFGIEDIPISKFRWLGFEVFKRLISKDHRRARLVQGQLRIQKTVGDRTKYKDQELNLQMFESSYWLGELARLCADNSIQLFIVEMPGYRETLNQSGLGPHTITFKNDYKAKVYNFAAKEISDAFDPEGDWVANSHLNQKGAVTFTQMLVPILKAEL
jgi:hypothetical protein